MFNKEVHDRERQAQDGDGIHGLCTRVLPETSKTIPPDGNGKMIKSSRNLRRWSLTVPRGKT